MNDAEDDPVRPIDRLLAATTGEDHDTVHALIGLLDAVKEYASKCDIQFSSLSAHRLAHALVKAEVVAIGTDREESERCWFGTGPDLATLKGHAYQRVPGPIDQDHCELCLVMRHWSGKNGVREQARYSWNGATYFDMAFGRTDEPPCGDKSVIEAWLGAGSGSKPGTEIV